MLVNNVVVIGGGTAGWLTALSIAVHKPNYNIYLIQDPNSMPIGVGESTQPNLTHLICNKKNIYFDPKEFMSACSGTNKCGIYYTDWHKIGEDYWHPFSYGDPYIFDAWGAEPEQYYQKKIVEKPHEYSHKKYYEDIHPSYNICIKNKLCDVRSAAAWHIDAIKMVQFLQEKLKHKVTIIEPNKIEFFVDDDYPDKIYHVECDGSTVKGDIYFDCTGFSRAVMKSVSDCEMIEYHENVDSAFFGKVNYINANEECVAYTHAHAFEHGWMWTIPLQDRMGVGCVFTKNTISKEDCKKMFIDYWDGRIDENEIQNVDFQCGALKKCWVGNVITAGLSSGFIEPLEATSISWCLESVNTFLRLLATDYYDETEIDFYNSTMLNYVNDIFDFIDVHYKLSKRTDSEFWKYHSSRRHNDRLENKLLKFKKETPNKNNKNQDCLWAFNHTSWIDILNGYEFQYDKQPDLENDVNDMILTREIYRRKCLGSDETMIFPSNLEHLKLMMTGEWER